MNKNYQKAFGIVLVLVFTFLALEVMTRYRVGGVIVYAPNKELKQRHRILEEDLDQFKVSKHLIDESMILDKEELIGRYVSLNHTLYPRTAISSHMLDDLDQVHDKPLLLLKDKQSLFSMKADQVTSAGGALSSGHVIDLNLVVNAYREEPIAERLFSNVRVVGVKDRKGQETQDSGEAASVILLAIDSETLPYLLKAQSIGTLVLSAKGFVLEGQECLFNEAVVSLFEA